MHSPDRSQDRVRRAVFLDKDGTLIDNTPYNVDPRRIRLSPRAPEALRLLHESGFRLVIVSNQSGVARGYFTEEALRGVADRLHALLEECGVPLAGFEYCPHHPGGTVPGYAIDCDCRKPATGLVLGAARRLRIDLSASWLIGDILDDIEAGRRSGCRTVLLDNGGETEWRSTPDRLPHVIANDLYAAACSIVAHSGPQVPSFAPNASVSGGIFP